MIVYHGSIRKFHQFDKDTDVQKKLPNDIETIGTWCTSDIHSAKPFAIGSETVIEKSETEFWDDGEPKVIQYDKPVHGYVYKVFIDEPTLKEYDSYDLFMEVRDQYCDYAGAGCKNRSLTWKDKAILLNKKEANAAFLQSLTEQGYDGLTVRSTKLNQDVTDLYCIFSEDTLQIADTVPVDSIE